MEKLTRRRYTLEYRREVVRLVTSGQNGVDSCEGAGIFAQTLANSVKADKAGHLRGVKSEQVSADRMEINRLRTELVRLSNTNGPTALSKETSTASNLSSVPCIMYGPASFDLLRLRVLAPR
jgi:transposase-like protein